MPKTDWEAVVRDLKVTANIGRLETICELIQRHTRRTEEDLPKNAWHWVKGPEDKEWIMAYFDPGHFIMYAFTPDGVDKWYQSHRLELEIGPQIMPPGGEE